MVYKGAIGWLSEGELLLPIVPLILGRISKPAYQSQFVVPLMFRRLPASPAGSLTIHGK